MQIYNWLKNGQYLFHFSVSYLILVLTYSSNTFAQTVNPNLDRSFPTPSSNLPTTTEYTLGAGDVIKINVFQVAEYSGEYLILPNGEVTLPVIGSVKLGGLSLTSAQQILSQLYAAYVKRPVITISLATPRPLKIAIVGEVNIPGSYNVSWQTGERFPSLTDLLKNAGGLTTVADISQVELRRSVEGKEQIFTLNLWNLLQEGNLSEDIVLQDGDRIFIPTKVNPTATDTRLLTNANFGIQTNQDINIVVTGEIYRPGSYQIEARKTSSDTSTSSGKSPRLSQAIQLAGGIKPLANIRNIEVVRFNYNGSEQKIIVDLWELLQSADVTQDLILQDGDRIIVPRAEEIASEEVGVLASASFAPQAIRVNVVGEVEKPGTVELPPNTTLNQGILAAGGFDKGRANETTVELIRLNPNGTVSNRKISVNFNNDINEETNPLLRHNDVIVINRNSLTVVTDNLNNILSPIGTALGLYRIFD
jgi:polysaccharide export outer membrane protein